MNLDETLLEQIHRYLSGQMDEVERQQFARQMSTDNELATEVELQRQIKAAYKIRNNKTLLTGIHEELMAQGQLWQPNPPQQTQAADETNPLPHTQSVRRLNWGYYAAAACVLLAVAFGWFALRQQPATQSPDQIAKQEPVTPVPSSENPIEIPAPATNPVPAPAPKAEERVVGRFEKLFRDNFRPTVRRTPPDPALENRLGVPLSNRESMLRLPQDTTNILTGIQLLRRGKVRQAITLLAPATQAALPDWQANARWFLALAYLKSNQTDKARQELQALLTGKTDLYKQDAQAVLDQL
ncbi:hypothetical protein GCM10023189_10510 [Nibrella saemangeumensis]|uniref:Tetratricopeptide repeat protein n=1 Tax=Nibrella saemangeumensis TaxID=1084526 RepID=A0ABP8MH04_9BACT